MACKKCTSACSCRLKVADTNTIDLSLSGTGSANAPWTVSGVALIDNRDPNGPYPQGSPQADAVDANGNFLREITGADGGLAVYPSSDDQNRVQVGTDGGIFVPPGDVCVPDDQGRLVQDDDGCISLVLAPDQPGTNFPCENALECLDDGLFVHVPKQTYVELGGSPVVTIPWPDMDGQRYVFGANGLVTPGEAGVDNINFITLTNPDGCCAMAIEYDIGFRERIQYNGDFCGAAQAFLNAGPRTAGGFLVAVSHRGFLNDGNAGVLSRTAFSILVDTGIPGCGVEISQFRDDQPIAIQPLIIGPGSSVEIGYWTEYNMGPLQGIPVNDPQLQALYQFMRRFFQSDAGPAVFTGISNCDLNGQAVF